MKSLSSSSLLYVLLSPILQNGSHQFSHLVAGFSINVQNWFSSASATPCLPNIQIRDPIQRRNTASLDLAGPREGS